MQDILPIGKLLFWGDRSPKKATYSYRENIIDPSDGSIPVPTVPIIPPGGSEIMSIETEEPETQTDIETQSTSTDEMILVATVTESHDYIYASGKLLRETITTTTVTNEETTTETQILDFFYDNNGTPFAVKIDDVVYYYITNLQGDVMNLVDADGTAVATYDYDPFGNVIAADGVLAEINPLRYRGYYYDTESSLYYLQSRYYDSAFGRFINADALASTGQGIIGYNMFAYCGNNPINLVDPTGELAFPGEIHNEVVRRIARKYGFSKEQKITFSAEQKREFKKTLGTRRLN